MNKIIDEFIKQILTELSFRKKDGIPDLKSEKDLDILHSILIEMGYSEISDELIKNIVEGGGGEPKEDEPPIDIDKDKIEFVGKDAEDLQAKIDYAGLTDAGFGFYSNADGKVIYKKDDSGLKLIPATQEELDDINRKIQKDKSVFNSPEGQEYLKDLPDTDPLKQKIKSVNEFIENILDSYLTEASYLDDKYKIGHQIIFNKETPPKWAPNLKTGDILTIVPDDTNVTTYGTGEFVKTLQLPNGEKVRVADKNRDGGDSKLFMHLKKGEVEPSGEDWEALIVCAYNGIDESSPEWKRAKIYWAKHEEDAKKIANSFSKILKSKKIKQLGSSTAQKNPDWLGKDPTPKTDILGDANEKISLKKEGGSQLMSAGKEETISTFNAAMKMVGENKPKIIEQFLDKLETKMGKMSEAGTISALEKLKNSGEKLTPDQQKKIAEMDQLQLNAKEINKDINSIFEDIYFKSCFCFEAATGTNKFADKNAVANKLIEFNPNGKISANLTINNIEDAKVLAVKNSFYVSFKTGSASSKPYLSLRTKQIKLENITFKDIIYEEFYKNNIGRKIITEVNKKQLNEFEIFNKLVKGIKNVSSTVRDQVKNILKNIINRVKEVIDHIKTLGSKMFNAIMNFLGMNVDDVKIKTSGPFPLI